jgi:cell division protein FtsW (lipid II flippase)
MEVLYEIFEQLIIWRLPSLLTNIHTRSKKKEKYMFLKRNARAHTYTKCLHHWLTAAFALFFYSFFCVCTAHINAIISLFSCFFILSTSLPLSLTCFMCVCVCILLSFFLPLLSRSHHIHRWRHSNWETKSYQKKKERVWLHNHTQQ